MQVKVVSIVIKVSTYITALKRVKHIIKLSELQAQRLSTFLIDILLTSSSGSLILNGIFKKSDSSDPATNQTQASKQDEAPEGKSIRIRIQIRSTGNKSVKPYPPPPLPPKPKLRLATA